MKKELIYLWINQDENNCFIKEGFNFSPLYRVEFNFENKQLCINLIDAINVFSAKNISSVSAVIGENGSGKTTLFKYINSLCNVPILENNESGYENFDRLRKDERAFIAVYAVEETEFKIINCTGNDLYYNNETYTTYSAEDYNKENFIGGITHICITNSEYGIDSNMFHEGIDHITIQNSSLKHIATSFYEKSIHFPTGLIENSKFNALQSTIIQGKTNTDFQQILDVMFYGKIAKTNTSFPGKEINKLKINFNNVANVLNRAKSNIRLSYNTNLISEDIINKVLKEFELFLKTVKHQQCDNIFCENLIYNLVFELYFISDFRLNDKESMTLETAYEQCRQLIMSGKLSKNEENYYKIAIEEIDFFIKKFKHMTKTDNMLPKNDLAACSYLEVDVIYIYKLFKKIIDSSCVSFIAKYINVFGLEMSSGERALLNLMSRLDLISLFAHYSNIQNAQVKDDILILIDEIDLYVHPNGQTKIISAIIEQINTVFCNKRVQIMISSHSPIVLSDMPRENTIYLRKDSKGIVVEPGMIYPQTFAANIFSLYKNSFFVENGIGMGDYARKFIIDLFAKVSSDAETNLDVKKIEKLIGIIGEPIIKRKLASFVNKNKESEIIPIIESEKDRVLKFLRDQKAEIEKQIKLLGGKEND